MTIRAVALIEAVKKTIPNKPDPIPWSIRITISIMRRPCGHAGRRSYHPDRGRNKSLLRKGVGDAAHAAAGSIAKGRRGGHCGGG